MKKVIVRWWDGYIETFRDVVDWRAGADLLWIKMAEINPLPPSGTVLRPLEVFHHRHIPLNQVRWFEPIPDEMER